MSISKKRLWEIEAIQDEEIDYSDIPELDDTFFEKAAIQWPPSRPKKHFTMRLDHDVFEWFQKHGRGYQSRINAVLRSYYEAHKDNQTKRS
ncbi:MAG: BrnA antitoxin family protein [Methylococcales bacterium]